MESTTVKLALSRRTLAEIEGRLGVKIEDALAVHTAEYILTIVKTYLRNFFPDVSQKVTDGLDRAIEYGGSVEIYQRGQGLAWFLLKGTPVGDKLVLQLHFAAPQ
jgi:hypothetical protein